MRRFKTTPMKKLVGMLILFVFLPLFLLWYWVFFLGHKPGTDTMIILAAVAVLCAFLYYRYKKQAALAKAQSGISDDEGSEGLPEEDSDEMGVEEAEGAGEEGLEEEGEGAEEEVEGDFEEEPEEEEPAKAKAKNRVKK
jgi:hypothetical protein